MLWTLASSTAQAFTQEITASFQPDPTNVQFNKFKNTTPESGICPGHIPAVCKALNIFSIRIPMVFRSNQPILANHEDPRKGAMFQLPSSFRDVQVTHSLTGDTSTVRMRIAGVGALWELPRPPGVSAWALPGVSWGSQWMYAPPPCLSTGFLAASNYYAMFFWIVPKDAGVCSRRPGTDIPRLSYNILEFAYEIETPNPLAMDSGEYTGSLTYTLGPQADFDFGDVMIPDDPILTFNFALSVLHLLKVEIPPGGNTVELVPQGGWQAWLKQGRKPVRLFRDQTVNLHASSRFKMQLDCQYAEGDNNCRIVDSVSGHSVPVHVSVTLPHGITDQAGSAVNRKPLRRDGVGTELFQPTIYVDRKPVTLHFEVLRDDVEQMLHPGETRTYNGNITVIWDSQV